MIKTRDENSVSVSQDVMRPSVMNYSEKSRKRRHGRIAGVPARLPVVLRVNVIVSIKLFF